MVRADCIVACASTLTGIKGTFIDIEFAFLTSKSWIAQAVVRTECVVASASVLTGVKSTFIDIEFTVKSWSAQAVVRADCIVACASTLTGMGTSKFPDCTGSGKNRVCCCKCLRFDRD